MGLFDFLKPKQADGGHGVEELARRLGMVEALLRSFAPKYAAFEIRKRGGGARKILAPDKRTKALQRAILHRVLGGLRAHPAAMGFEGGRSIVHNASAHANKAIVARMDVVNFFGSTKAKRVEAYFSAIGWNREASALLSRFCCHEGALPQGAPTSPRLSNLVNARMDARIAAFAKQKGIAYTRYADDITLSAVSADHAPMAAALAVVRKALGDEGYMLHKRKKRSVRRRHQRQIVTGLVVNGGPPRLPRETRRMLRAVAHRHATGRDATLSPEQAKGWHAYLSMVAKQSSG